MIELTTEEAQTEDPQNAQVNPQNVETAKESSYNSLKHTKVVEAIVIEDKGNAPGSPTHFSPIIQAASPNVLMKFKERKKFS